MAVERNDLESLNREHLVERARAAGIERPEVLTRLELLDEILTASITDDQERRAARGLLGRARDLVARVVEKGLNLPDAAQRLRTLAPPMAAWRRAPPPIATVSLAEIYAGQGHDRLARKVLDEVLEREPDHTYARMLRDRMSTGELADEGLAVPVVAVPAPPPILKPPAPQHGQPLPSAPRPAIAPAPEPAVAPAVQSPALADVPCAVAHRLAEPAHAPNPGFPLDDGVQLELDHRRARLTWQLRPRSFARARAASPDGHLVVRLLRVEASWEGPRGEFEDVRVDALKGGLIRELPASAAGLCAAIGWLSPEGFAPIASAPASPRAL